MGVVGKHLKCTIQHMRQRFPLVRSRAVEIHEKHNLDANQSMLAFRFDDSEKLELGPSCERINPLNIREPPFKISWWPVDVPPSKISTYRHSFYSCEHGEAFLALSVKLGEGFYLRP